VEHVEKLHPDLVAQIERRTGKTIEELRSTPIDEMRREVEKKCGPMRVLSRWPLIGRGSIMRDYVKTSAEIDREFEHALRDDD
jgi:hypothetical protein